MRRLSLGATTQGTQWECVRREQSAAGATCGSSWPSDFHREGSKQSEPAAACEWAAASSVLREGVGSRARLALAHPPSHSVALKELRQGRMLPVGAKRHHLLRRLVRKTAVSRHVSGHARATQLFSRLCRRMRAELLLLREGAWQGALAPQER